MSPNDDEASDSKTIDVKRLGGRRSRVTVRVKPELKKALKKLCLAEGISICHLFELLVTGYLEGRFRHIDLDVKSPTIELTVVREVKRVRRYAKEPVGEAVIEESGSYSQCCLCGERPVVEAFYWPDESRCNRVYYCGVHWREHKPRGGFSGFRML